MLHFSMPRICLCLSITLFVATAAPVLARETKHSSPKGGSCAEAQAAAKEAAPATQATPVTDGERESRSQPTVHSDAPASGRLSPRRWHSFLPGMVR